MPISKKRKKLLLLAAQQTAFRAVIDSGIRVIEFVVPDDEAEESTPEVEELSEAEDLSETDIECLDAAVDRLA